MTVDANDARVLPVDPGFHLQAAVADRTVKGEDIFFMHRAEPGAVGCAMPAYTQDPKTWKLHYDVFCVCDGHSGTAAANFVKEHLLQTLHPLMPTSVPPTFRTGGVQYAQTVRWALSTTLVKLNKLFSMMGIMSGCTCTVAVVTGVLLTVANLGEHS